MQELAESRSCGRQVLKAVLHAFDRYLSFPFVTDSRVERVIANCDFT